MHGHLIYPLTRHFVLARVMLSFFSLFFVRWVYFILLIINNLQYFNKIN